MTPIISVENASKRFVLNEYRPSLRQEAVGIFKRTLGQASGQWEREPFWALRDMSFSVMQGERLAVIGRNGAGKTTLLRLLSQVSTPTHGTVEVHGRFASLIGLGAGFDLERTGRENIYLNALIQGLQLKAVQEAIDDIIAFAELGKFIDIPVKRYSSGMVARLGFSVAIHTAPEILFIDEALSVGDIAFQEKCYDRIMQFSHERRTIVFVTHAMATAARLCDRALWLHEGKLVMDSRIDEVIKAYKEMLTFTL